MKPSVLALGLDPACVDAAELGGFAPHVVRAFIEAELDRLRDLGYDVECCLVDLGPAAEAAIAARLDVRAFDCVMIGAGLRAPRHVLQFERVLNLVHAKAPAAKICFNTSPADSAETVQRWVPAKNTLE